jgi:hypothetical protein
VDGSSQIVNFGRSAMKQLLQAKWGMNLMYGDGPEVLDRTPFGGADEIRMTGDFNGDHRTDVIRFTQKSIDGIGPAPVFVRRVVGTPQTAFGFSDEEVWHKFFSLKGEIPMVGDFNGDGKSDIITFTQQEQHFSDGSLIGPAPVWVAISNGTSFNTSAVWHKFFSLKGEIPMVGDFNGDGKDDIATFVQQPQFDAAGNLIGHAPVWVALSNGHGFDPSRIWHTFFSAHGELPRVADIDMDGKADIITFLQGTGSGIQARNVYVAFSTGSRFETSTMFASDQVSPGEVPYFGSFSGVPLGRITGQSSDLSRFFPDLYIFRPSGPFAIAHAMGRIPFQTGAPWERYKWFPEKAIGAAQFPEWIYETGPNHCLTSPFRFILGGLGGSGGAVTMVSSVRTGARAPHILQEFGHALFANCMRENLDPFGLFNLIFNTPMDAGGLDANHMPGCGGFDDCRDPEHFFLGLMVEYRSFGDEFRKSINAEPDPVIKDRRRKQYLWFKTNWYKGAEFKRGTQSDVSLFVDGVLCLPGECSIQ